MLGIWITTIAHHSSLLTVYQWLLVLHAEHHTANSEVWNWRFIPSFQFRPWHPKIHGVWKTFFLIYIEYWQWPIEIPCWFAGWDLVTIPCQGTVWKQRTSLGVYPRRCKLLKNIQQSSPKKDTSRKVKSHSNISKMVVIKLNLFYLCYQDKWAISDGFRWQPLTMELPGQLSWAKPMDCSKMLTERNEYALEPVVIQLSHPCCIKLSFCSWTWFYSKHPYSTMIII